MRRGQAGATLEVVQCGVVRCPSGIPRRYQTDVTSTGTLSRNTSVQQQCRHHHRSLNWTRVEEMTLVTKHLALQIISCSAKRDGESIAQRDRNSVAT